MINVHSEILPDFRGAQSIIWPIFEGRNETGFTIHQIDRHIDTGEILFQKRYPIVLCPTLSETVERTSEIIREEIPEALAWVCQNYEQLKEQAQPQGKGKSYTTPSFSEFRRMLRNHKAMYQHVNNVQGG
jgi:methionyl-tRNA formyltransferase